jgi:hypothetical protein
MYPYKADNSSEIPQLSKAGLCGLPEISSPLIVKTARISNQDM